LNSQVYRYEFLPDVTLKDVEDSLMLSALAVECMHGRSMIRLDAKFRLDLKKRSCVIDAGTEVGRNIAKIFTGFITRQFGEGSFKVERTFPPPETGRDPQPMEAAP